MAEAATFFGLNEKIGSVKIFSNSNRDIIGLKYNRVFGHVLGLGEKICNRAWYRFFHTPLYIFKNCTAI